MQIIIPVFRRSVRVPWQIAVAITTAAMISMLAFVSPTVCPSRAPSAPATFPIEASSLPQHAGEQLSHLAGCFSVRYQFVEDGEHDFFIKDAVEYMHVRTDEANTAFRVHNYLIPPERPDLAFLHWVQIWRPMEDGRWHLRVEDGAGGLRYQGPGMWRFNQWEGQPARAKKPTRDLPRQDYDLLERRNTLQITAQSWIHSEINLKLRADGTPVASELGWIVYERMENDDACVFARSLPSKE